MKSARKRSIFGEIRAKLGISQEYFGQIFKISRSQMSMIERGKRQLHGTTYMIFAKMLSDTLALEKGALANYRSLETRLILNDEYRKVLPLMQAQEKACRAEVLQYKQKLNSMKEQARDSENFIIVITRLADGIKEDPAKSRELEWLLLIKQYCYDRLFTCWEPEQVKLQIKIEALAGEARALRICRLKIKGVLTDKI